MWRFLRVWGDVAKRSIALLWSFYARGDLLAGAVGLVVGVSVNAWLKLIPWWGVLIGVLLLILYAIALAVYGKITEIEDKKEALEETLEERQKRAALNDLLGDAYENGQRIEDLGNGGFLEWANYTLNLLQAAFGKSQAQYFISDRDIGPSLPQDAKAMYSYIPERLVGNRLRRLEEMMNRTDLPIRPDFDPQALVEHVGQFSVGQIDPSVALTEKEAEKEWLEAIEAERVEKARKRRELIRELFGLIEEGNSYAYGSYATHKAVSDWEARASKLI